MKKITAILLGTLIASSAALAQTNQVLSRNAVGYIKKSVPGNSIALMTVPFVNLSESQNTLSNTFAAASNLTQISLWDPSVQVYRTFQKSKGTWGAPGSNVIARGAGLFFRSPAGVAQEVFTMGEVPDSITAPTTSVGVVAGVNALGFPYPVSTYWTNTVLANALTNLSQISVWNGTNYVTIQKSKGSWGVTGNSLVLAPGEGFFVRMPVTAPSLNWTESKTNYYRWP